MTPPTEEMLAGRLDTIEHLLVQHLKIDKQIAGQQDTWHLKKEVTVAHILTSIGVVALVIASWYSLSGAVAAIDNRTATITNARMTRVELQVENTAASMREGFQSINENLGAINGKLDVLEERSIENRRD
jgi:hypothetical protein